MEEVPISILKYHSDRISKITLVVRCEENDQLIPLAKGQWRGKRFHVMMYVIIPIMFIGGFATYGCITYDNLCDISTSVPFDIVFN